MRLGTVGRYRGPQPRSKASMMIMRPPQQGQACASVCGSPSPVLSASPRSFCDAGRLKQLTRSRDVLDAPAVGERTVVADAVETLRQDVGKKAADEIVDGKRHHPTLSPKR